MKKSIVESPWKPQDGPIVGEVERAHRGGDGWSHQLHCHYPLRLSPGRPSVPQSAMNHHRNCILHSPVQTPCWMSAAGVFVKPETHILPL